MFSNWKYNSLKKKADNFFIKRQDDRASDADVAKEIKIHYQLIKLYKKRIGSKKHPYSCETLQESYRVCASLEHAESQYQLSKLLFDKANFWKGLQSGCYASKITEKYMIDTFQEAHSYLNAAKSQDHPLAVRMYGLALIHGWGIDVNDEEGFQYIVKSIEIEKSWDKATQIFEELGLNKPEFFNSIVALKNKSK